MVVLFNTSICDLTGNCLDGRCQPGWIYVFKVILRGRKLSSVPLPLKFFSSVANQNRLIKLLDAFSIEHLITLLNIYDNGGSVPTKHSKTGVHINCFREEYWMALPISCLCTLMYCNKRLHSQDYRMYSCILTTFSVDMLHISQTGDSADLRKFTLH